MSLATTFSSFPHLKSIPLLYTCMMSKHTRRMCLVTLPPCSMLIVYCKLYRQVKRNHHLSECLCLHHPSILPVHFAQFYPLEKQSLMVIQQSLQNRESCLQELLLLKKRHHQKVLKLFQILVCEILTW